MTWSDPSPTPRAPAVSSWGSTCRPPTLPAADEPRRTPRATTATAVAGAAVHHPHRSRASFQTDPTRGREPAAGIQQPYLRGGRLQPLLPQPALRAADRVRPDLRGLVRRRQSRPQRRTDLRLCRVVRPDPPPAARAVISVKGPDVRWVGTEGGHGRTTEWSVVPLSHPPEASPGRTCREHDLGSRAKLTPGSHLWWYPAEVNTSILNGWFWSAEKRPEHRPPRRLLLLVHRPQRQHAPQPRPRHPRPDSRRPAGVAPRDGRGRRQPPSRRTSRPAPISPPTLAAPGERPGAC